MCFRLCWCWLVHAVHVTLESIDVSGPEAAELSKPRIHLLKRFRLQPVETALCVHGRFHETSVAQLSQVLGHSRLRHSKLTVDLSHRLLRRDQQAQDCAASRLSTNFQGRFHPCISTSQGIYVTRNITEPCAGACACA